MIPPGEKISEVKKCRISGKQFHVTDRDLEFYDKISPTFSGKKYPIPSPTLCPEERQRRRLLWHSQGFLFYARKCDFSGSDIVSSFHQESPYQVYSQEIWWGHEWSPSTYARDFDFSKDFFSQYNELSRATPHPALFNYFGSNTNSDYIKIGGRDKNCYLCRGVASCENFFYGNMSRKSKNCMDSYGLTFCENCYQCITCENCYGLTYSQDCTNSRESQYLINCHDCAYCYMCCDLKNKTYHILNEAFSREEYFEKLEKLTTSSSARNDFDELIKKRTVCSMHGNSNEDITGDYIFNSKNSYECFDARRVENCKFCYNVVASGSATVNCYDFDYFGGMENSYEFVNGGSSSFGVHFCVNTFENIADIFYCSDCFSIKNCFGCCGLHSYEHHCILNKSYSVNEYEELCGKIIDHMRSTGEWGEFFPHELSPFGYNETVANEYFPMTETDVKGKGWNWYTAPQKKFEGLTIASLAISQYDEKVVGFEIAQKNIDNLLSGILQCEITNKPFKIISQELAFYIENHLPIPTKHPDQRHKERMALRNPRELHERICPECHKQMITTYAPDRVEKVVCEECYRKLTY